MMVWPSFPTSLQPHDKFWVDTIPGFECYHALWTDSQGRTQHSSLRTRDRAVALRIVEDWNHVGTFNEQQKSNNNSEIVTISELLQWDFRQYGAALASRDVARAACQHLGTFAGNRKIREITPRFSADFVKYTVNHGLTLGYAQRLLTVLRAAAKRAYEERLLPFQPVIKNVETQADRDAAPDKGRVMSTEEIARLIDAADSPHFLFVLVLAVNTLSRPDAILDLKAQQVDLANKLIFLNAKQRRQSKKYRPTIRIPETLLPWLLDLRDGSLITYHDKAVSSIKTAMRRARSRAGLDDDVSLYSLRHTGGRYLRKNNVPEDQIALQLGHLPSGHKRTTLKYSRHDPLDANFLQRSAEVLARFTREIACDCKKHNILVPLKNESSVFK